MSTAIFAVLLLLWSSTAFAQHWNIVGRFNGTMCPYFLNDSVGFVYNNYGGIAGPPGSGNPGYPNLYKSTNGGMTWSSAIGQLPENTADLFFTSPFHGYAACNTNAWNGSQGGGIFETTNGGVSWQRITPSFMTYTSGVYSVHDTLYASNPVLYFSSNGGSTWLQSIGTKVGPPAGFQGSVTGNFDEVVISPDGGHGDDSGAIYTTNGGQTWARGTKLHAAFSACVLPHNLECFRAEEEYLDPNAQPGQYVKVNGGEIGHSTDGGATWSAQHVPGQPYLTGGITAGGCKAVYAQRERAAVPDSGLIRTTDHGQTWIPVGGPSGLLDHRLCAVGTGATVFAMDAYHNIWKTTDGGDGALSASDWPSLAVAHLGAPKDTLITKLCDSAGFQFTLTNAGCLRYFLDSVAIDSIGPNGYYTVLHNRFIGDGQPSDTALITILPKQPGTYPLTVHGRLRREDWLEIDTTFHLTLVIHDNPGVLNLAAKPLYDFGVQSMCKPRLVTDSFSVSAHGCEAVTVDSIVFQPISGSGFTFKKVKSFTAPATGTVALHFPVSYKPTQAEMDSGRIVIFSFDGTAHHTDTLLARGSAVADSRSFVIASDTLTTRMCDSVTGTLTLQNPTCNSMEIDSISLPASLTLLSSLPVRLDTGSTSTLSVRVIPGSGIAPLHVGDTALAVRIHVVGTSPFDTTVTLNVHISRGTPAMVLSTNGLLFDTVSTCSSKTLGVVIQSTGCDTLTCSGSVLTPPFRVVGGDPAALPVGARDTVLVTFASPAPGLFYDTLVIMTNAGRDIVPLQAFALADAAALAGGSLAMPQVVASCGGDTGQIDLPNLSCTGIVIDSVTGVCVPFRVLSGIGDTIPSSGSGHLRVSYIPQSAGLDACIVRAYYHGADGVEHDTTYSLSASAIAPPQLNVHLVQAAFSASKQEHVTIPVRANATSAIAYANIIAFRLNMRTDLLTPLSVSSPIVGAQAVIGQSDYSGVNISVALPQGFALSVDTVIANVDCQTFVTDTMRTSISVTQPTISSQTTCLSIDSASPAITFALDPACGDSLLSHYIDYQSFTIESIIPNPAQSEVRINFENSTSTPVVYEVLDALGIVRAHGMTTEATLSLDVSGFASGVYILRARSAGFASMKRFMVRK
ncbi:MAG: T9SS type A sorting domain-containing protein [Bacteroidota bacterium]|nr:T9SS type A sorting domain-containing protein [Bacteroidota bacterium]MDP4232774.1 T9SS type A sorting domain-containing protein [Bacteroidota bacterium]